MQNKTVRIILLALSLVAASLIGLTVGASSGAGGGAVGSFLAAHFGQRDHYCPHATMEELGLTEEQRQSFDKIHEMLGAFGAERRGEHVETLSWFLERVQEGDLTVAETQQVIDRHLEEMRTLAYAVSDEFVTVLQSLDEEQRQLVAGHMEQMVSGGHERGGFLRSLHGHIHGHGEHGHGEHGHGAHGH